MATPQNRGEQQSDGYRLEERIPEREGYAEGYAEDFAPYSQTSQSMGMMPRTFDPPRHPQLLRFSAWALLLSCIFGIPQAFLFPLLIVYPNNPIATPGGPMWVLDAVLFVASTVLLLAGLPGLQAKQASQSRIAGIVALIIIFVGSLGFIASVFPLPISYDLYNALYNGSNVLTIVGYVLFGILLMGRAGRTAAFPRWIGIAIIFSSVVQAIYVTQLNIEWNLVVNLIISFANVVPFCMAIAACGYAMLSERSKTQTK
jgi:hypothetical protein